MPREVKQFSVYWFDPEPAIGSELRKIRPAVVVSPDAMNRQLRTVLVAPITSTVRPWPFRTTVAVKGKQSSVAFDQLKVVDKSRLQAHVGDLSTTDSRVVLQTLQQIFAG